MIEAPHYSAVGASKKAVALPEALFDGTVNPDVLPRAVLTATESHNVYLSGRNIPDVHVMRFADATAYEILWAQTVVVEIEALDEGAATKDAKEASDA